MDQNEKYLKVAIAAAKQSGKIFQKYCGHPKRVEMKNGNPLDLVTEIDKQIETQIRKTVLKNFPKHKIIGEELGKSQLQKNDLVWIIDPIDGTTNYIQGLPLCCMSIALWDSKGPKVAALYNPVLKQLFTAIRGQGAKLNNKPIKISKEKSLGGAFGGVGWSNPKEGIKLLNLLMANARKTRVLGTSALQICLVASGNLDFYITSNAKVWDFAAAALVATEAGAKVTDILGKPLNIDTKSIIASGPQVHKELLAKLKSR